MSEAQKTVINELIGQTIVKINKGGAEFKLADGRTFYFWHQQSCCEVVDIEDVTGDFEDLLDTPLLAAYETTRGCLTPEAGDSDPGALLFTFYHFRTHKGDVCVRWRGESNGYYGITVDYGFQRKHG